MMALGIKRRFTSRKCAKVLVKSCRSEDIICRWGGDEFAIFPTQNPGRRSRRNCGKGKAWMYKHGKQETAFKHISWCSNKTEQSQNLQKVIKSAEDGMYRRKLVERNSISNSILICFQQSSF